MEIKLFPVFRQKIGDVYHFEVLAIKEDLSSSTAVGFVVCNVKSGKTNYSVMGSIPVCNIRRALEDINKQITNLEVIFNPKK